jgi:hypothetical protein
MQNLTLISNPLKRLQKESCKKSSQQKSGTKIEFLTFIAVFERFQSNSSFERIFCIFSHGFKLSIKFYVFDTHMEFFSNTFFLFFLALFATFKPNIDKTANVPKYSISHPSSQKVKIVVTYCTGCLSKSKGENV